MVPVILSGGSGTRLWPLSRRDYPKQFLRLASSEHTLLQSTAIRNGFLSSPLVVANEAHRFLVEEQLGSLDIAARILLEPHARNTAPAIALAAMDVLASGEDSLMLVTPADHVISGDMDQYQQIIAQSAVLARQGYLVTFGIRPTKPETAYGYIQSGVALAESEGLAHQIAQFVEKPDRNTAQGYLEAGHYFWNSGIFVFDARVFLDELHRLRPEITEVVEAAFGGMTADLDFFRAEATAYERCPSESVDYAVMEHTDRAAVIPLPQSIHWSDIGSWQALYEYEEEASDRDDDDVITIDSTSNMVRSDGKLVALIGVDDLIVVDTADALLVASQSASQQVKRVVDELSATQRQESLQHRKVFRPWGHYDSVDAGDRFQVKRITVKPGKRLSLQKHYHRSEHWVVVRGTAIVTVGSERKVLTEDESIYIPLGAVHRLENPGKVPLEIIEVQTGRYLEEDDIERIEDEYGRG